MRAHLCRAAPACALAALLAFAACGGSSASSATTRPSGPATTTADISARVQKFTVPSRNHTTNTVVYPQTPPVGGDHYPIWQNCGFYAQAIQTELGVHSMEHGAVWITYQPTLPQAQVNALRDLAHSHTYVLVSPWTVSALPSPVVASAWGVQLQAISASDPGIVAFIKAYDQGPQTPEPGAACSGGFGTPQ